MLLRAAEVLEDLGPKARPALPELAAILRAPDDGTELGATAARCLGAFPQDAATVVPLLIAALKNPGRRWSALNALANLGPAAAPAVPQVIDLLRDPDPNVRDQACLALGHVGPDAKAAVPHLQKLLDDPDLRASAIRTLGQIGPDARAAVPQLVALLRHRRDWDQELAVVALSRIGDASAVPGLVAALRDGPEAQRAACRVLSALGPAAKAALPPLLDLVRQGQSEAAGQAVGDLGTDSAEVIRALVLTFGREPVEDGDLVPAPLEALAYLGPEARAAIPALIEGLLVRRGDDGLTAGVVRALVRLSEDGGDLAALVADLDRAGHFERGYAEELRGVVVEELGRLGPAAAAAVPTLIEGLASPDVAVRWRAAAALGRVGPVARKAVPALTRALNDADPAVRRWAADSLRRVRAEAPKEKG
jgi:HEAT repeat protein